MKIPCVMKIPLLSKYASLVFQVHNSHNYEVRITSYKIVGIKKNCTIMRNTDPSKNFIHEPYELVCGEWIPHARLVVLHFEQE